MLLAQSADRTDMIGVVVRYEDTPDVFQRNVMKFQGMFDGAHADAGIDEEAVFISADIVAIAATTATHAHKTK